MRTSKDGSSTGLNFEILSFETVIFEIQSYTQPQVINLLHFSKFTSGYPDKMYKALDVGVRNTSSLAMYPNTDITEVMSSWISQPGHPILHVDINYATDEVVLTQVHSILFDSSFLSITHSRNKYSGSTSRTNSLTRNSTTSAA